MTPAQRDVMAQYVARRKQGDPRIAAASVVRRYFETQCNLHGWTPGLRDRLRVAQQHAATVTVNELQRKFGRAS
jgi:hypothetical protein